MRASRIFILVKAIFGMVSSFFAVDDYDRSHEYEQHRHALGYYAIVASTNTFDLDLVIYGRPTFDTA